jgi:3'-phosphoadenosine 5'-phosphosulfate sulfotransferase (PAPS reductase)/FAD synthetase
MADADKAHHRCLSLGAGVQSTTVLLLALDGALPPFDLVIFADTGDEPAAVYEHLDRLRAATTIETVTAGHLADTTSGTFVPVPLYWNGGMGRRQCTYQYKLRPIRRRLRDLGATAVDLAVCISVDEIDRAKDSGLKWCRNVFPLLELGWTRDRCADYLADRWPWPVPRSACVYCPLKSDREWLDLREHHPDDWAAAVAFDEAARPFGYVHRSERPLAKAILRPENAGQLALECEGMCGV